MARSHVQWSIPLSAFTPDKYDLLDTARMLRDIEAATGVTMFNNFSVLDVALQRRQMETGLGITLTQYSLLSPASLCAQVAVATASDSDTPEWVPANAKIHIDLAHTVTGSYGSPLAVIDFENATYSVGATSKTVEDLLVSDGGSFNVADISPENGWFPQGNDFANFGADLNPVFNNAAGFIAVVDAERGAGDGTFRLIISNGGADIRKTMRLEHPSSLIFLSVGGTGDVPAEIESVDVTTRTKFAFKVSPTQFALANLGSSKTVSTPDPSQLDTWDAGAGSIILNALGTPGWKFYSIKFYAGSDNINAIVGQGDPTGRAWTEADGEVAIDTLLGTDANTVNGWGATSYDAGNLTANGYTFPDLSLALIGAARTMVLDQATLRYKIYNITGSANVTSNFVLVAADGNDAIEFDLEFDVTASSWGGSASGTISPRITNGGVVGDINVAAITTTANRFDFAANGSDPVSLVLDATDRPPGNPYVASIFSADSDHALQSITIYDALPSTAGLSELSETGVTNTAPTAINSTWVDLGLVYGSNGSYRFNVVTLINAGNVQLISDLSAVDAEGNPCVLTLASDPGGKLAILTFGGSVGVWLTADFDASGAYPFILRATDPGGLYVEQQFTITVTA